MNRASVTSGSIFIAVGGLYGVTAYTSLPMGSMVEMGPGYFPVVLSSLLVMLGAVIALRGAYEGPEVALESVPWRAMLMLSLAILAFAFFVKSLGLLPTVIVSAFLACLADPHVSTWKAAVLSLALAVLCTLIFGIGIGLPVPIVGPWAGDFI